MYKDTDSFDQDYWGRNDEYVDPDAAQPEHPLPDRGPRPGDIVTVGDLDVGPTHITPEERERQNRERRGNRNNRTKERVRVLR